MMHPLQCYLMGDFGWNRRSTCPFMHGFLIECRLIEKVVEDWPAAVK